MWCFKLPKHLYTNTPVNNHPHTAKSSGQWVDIGKDSWFARVCSLFLRVKGMHFCKEASAFKHAYFC
jgi:hypothetical protein